MNSVHLKQHFSVTEVSYILNTLVLQVGLEPTVFTSVGMGF